MSFLGFKQRDWCVLCRGTTYLPTEEAELKELVRKGKNLKWRVEKDDCNCAEVVAMAGYEDLFNDSVVAHTRSCQGIDRVKTAMKKRVQVIGQLQTMMKELKSMVTRSKKFEIAFSSSSTDEHSVAPPSSSSNVNRATAPSSSIDGRPAFYSLYLVIFNTAVSYH